MRRYTGLVRGTWVVALCAACGAAPVAPPSHRADPAPPQLATADRDDDGVPDATDLCSSVPEDHDVFEDADGCPELDDDHDGVPDLKDRCFDTPGDSPFGCPEGCIWVVTTHDCFFLTPIWSEDGKVNELATVKQQLAEYPEIRQLTLRSRRTPYELPNAAVRRMDTVRRKLIALGVRPELLVTEEMPSVDTGSPDVFAHITKQRFEDGRFREPICVGGMGQVFRPSREKNYKCGVYRCGDGTCHRAEDHEDCPQDCPPP